MWRTPWAEKHQVTVLCLSWLLAVRLGALSVCGLSSPSANPLFPENIFLSESQEGPSLTSVLYSILLWTSLKQGSGFASFCIIFTRRAKPGKKVPSINICKKEIFVKRKWQGVCPFSQFNMYLFSVCDELGIVLHGYHALVNNRSKQLHPHELMFQWDSQQ